MPDADATVTIRREPLDELMRYVTVIATELHGAEVNEYGGVELTEELRDRVVSNLLVLCIKVDKEIMKDE